MPNGTYGGVRGRKTKVGRKLLRFPPTRFSSRTSISNSGYIISNLDTYIINNTRYFCIAITIGFICFN